MGAFYAIHAVKGPSQAEILAWLGRRRAFVSRTENDFTIIADETSEASWDAAAELSSDLSFKFNCPVLFIQIHDDDILTYLLHENGLKTDEYNSCPNYFGEDEADETDDEGPRGGNAERLADAFGASDVAVLEAALRPAIGTRFAFENERHAALNNILGMPAFSIGAGYEYLGRDDASEWMPPGTFTHTAS